MITLYPNQHTSTNIKNGVKKKVKNLYLEKNLMHTTENGLVSIILILIGKDQKKYMVEEYPFGIIYLTIMLMNYGMMKIVILLKKKKMEYRLKCLIVVMKTL